MADAAVSETHIGVVFFVGDRAYKLKSRWIWASSTSAPGSCASAPAGTRSGSTGGSPRRLPRGVGRARAGRRRLRPPGRHAADARRPAAVAPGGGGRAGRGRAERRRPDPRRLACPRTARPRRHRPRDARRPARPLARQLRPGAPLPRRRAGRGRGGRDRGSRHRVPRTASRCSTRASRTGAWSTATATCWPGTCSAWTTDHASSTAWSSTRRCARWTGSTTRPSWPWTSNASAPRSWPTASSAGTPGSPPTRRRPRCATTTSPTGRSSAPRSPACGTSRAARTPPPRRARTPTWRCGICAPGRSA